MSGLLISIALIFSMIVLLYRTIRYRLEKRPGSKPVRRLDIPKRNVKKSSTTSTIPLDSEATFIMCTFSMLAKLVAADGSVSEEEEARVSRFVDEQLALKPKAQALALRVFKQAHTSPASFQDYADRFKQTYPDRVQLHSKMIEILVEVAAADGILSPSEDKLIRSAALRLDLSEVAYERIKGMHITASNLIH